MTKEFKENNYMNALLRATILIGDLRRTVPVHEITICGYTIENHARRLYPRCKIVPQPILNPYAASATPTASPGDDYLVLFPLAESSAS